MKEVFDLIRQRLKKEVYYQQKCHEGFKGVNRTTITQAKLKMKECYEHAIEIFNQVANDGWIPVEERLPEERGWYQCTCADEEVWSKPIVRDLYFYPTLKGFIDNIRYETNGLRNIENYNWTKYVTAWQPLPKPYKPKGE